MNAIDELNYEYWRRIEGILGKYSATGHGPNTYTADALINVLAMSSIYDEVIKFLDGKLTSAYRSRMVNKAVGGAASSRHLDGLALDIVPAGSLDVAYAKLCKHAWHGAGGDSAFGCVRKIIKEPTWIHIDWWQPPWVTGGPMEFLRKNAGGPYIHMDFSETQVTK